MHTNLTYIVCSVASDEHVVHEPGAPQSRGMSLDPRIREVRGKRLVIFAAVGEEALHGFLESAHVLSVGHAVQEVQHALPTLDMASIAVLLFMPPLDGLAVSVRQEGVWRRLAWSTWNLHARGSTFGQTLHAALRMAISQSHISTVGL